MEEGKEREGERVAVGERAIGKEGQRERRKGNT